MTDLKVGDKVELTQSIYDDGEDHYPPGYLGLKGDIVIIKTIYPHGHLAVHHEDVTDGSAFKVFKEEYKPIT